MDSVTIKKRRIVQVHSMRTLPYKIKSNGEICGFCQSRCTGESVIGMVTCEHRVSHLVCEDCLAKLNIVLDSWKGFAKLANDEPCPCLREFADRLRK